MSIADHFFGQLENNRRLGEVSIPLYSTVKKAQLVGREHFTAQLRRLIGQHGRVVFTDGTSAPLFPELLQCLQIDQIGFVRLGVGNDLSEGHNLTCTLMFVEGTLEVRACWTGYKELRAYELVKTLLRPLRESGLAERTLFQQAGDDDTRLPQDSESQLLAVLSYHGEPYNEAAHGNLNNLVDQLDGKSRF